MDLAKENIKKAEGKGMELYGESEQYVADPLDLTKEPGDYCIKFVELLNKKASTKDFDTFLSEQGKNFSKAYELDNDILRKENVKHQIARALAKHGAIESADKITDTLIVPEYMFWVYKSLTKEAFKKIPGEIAN